MSEERVTSAAAVSDGFCVQGASHHVCQDYTAACSGCDGGEGSGEAWAVVCDGCSSAPYADWGARLLARAAAANVALLTPGDGERYHDAAIGQAAEYARLLDLTPLALTATLLTARTLGERLLVSAYGDGVVALRARETGEWRALSLSFAEGRAAYPSYRLDPETRALFRALEGNERLATPVGGDAPFPRPAAETADFLLWDVPRADYDAVALLTDGATSFTAAPGADDPGGGRRPVPPSDVLPLLLDFRRMTGGFARRSLHAFRKEARRRGWEHYDDLSMAALYLPPLP